MEESPQEKTEQVETEADKVERINEEMELDIINTTNAAAERLERANRANERILANMQKIQTEQILAGKADANLPEPPETDKEYAKRVMNNELEE